MCLQYLLPTVKWNSNDYNDEQNNKGQRYNNLVLQWCWWYAVEIIPDVGYVTPLTIQFADVVDIGS